MEFKKQVGDNLKSNNKQSQNNLNKKINKIKIKNKVKNKNKFNKKIKTDKKILIKINKKMSKIQIGFLERTTNLKIKNPKIMMNN